MNKLIVAAVLTGAAIVSAPAQAQMSMAQLPEICTAGMAAPMGAEMPMAHGRGPHSRALNEGMARMNQNMGFGMMLDDPDVAFICSMIPHHQGAIDMARVELEHGNDQWAKDMAQKVIDAQEQEIEEMLAWLEERAKSQ
jgi:uncharacterized protein (DUF305 family)